MNDEHTIKKIVEAIFDEKMHRLETQQELKCSEERLKRTYEWSNRFIAASIGFTIGLVFTATLSECSHLSSRVSSLESKQK